MWFGAVYRVGEPEMAPFSHTVPKVGSFHPSLAPHVLSPLEWWRCVESFLQSLQSFLGLYVDLYVVEVVGLNCSWVEVGCGSYQGHGFLWLSFEAEPVSIAE